MEVNTPLKLFERAMAKDRGGQLPMMVQRETVLVRVAQGWGCTLEIVRKGGRHLTVHRSHSVMAFTL